MLAPNGVVPRPRYVVLLYRYSAPFEMWSVGSYTIIHYAWNGEKKTHLRILTPNPTWIAEQIDSTTTAQPCRQELVVYNHPKVQWTVQIF